jgi:serine/threonine-protein kinase
VSPDGPEPDPHPRAAPPAVAPTPGPAPEPTREYQAPPATPAPHAGTTEADAAARAAPLAPTGPFGRYTLLAPAGGGGMGLVYRAWDPLLKVTVALKMLRAGVVASDAEVRRFFQEAQATARSRHPNIVQVYDVGEHAGRHYFTMEWAEGGTLDRHRARLCPDPRSAAAVAEKIARAVAHAHGKGVLHRDLKPSNILLDERGEPKVTDFGLAKLLDAGDGLTLDGAVLGTPAYMSPEQAAGKPSLVSARSDVWSLGVILFELLTGGRPFTGETAEATRQQVLTAEPPRVRSVRRAVPRALDAVVWKCLRRDPAERYASAAEVADDLASWLRGGPVTPQPDRWRTRLARAIQRRPLAAAAAALLLAAALTAAAGTYLGREPDPDAGAVVLVGKTGMPKEEPRWVIGEADSRWYQEADGTFTVSSTSQGFADLAQDPGSDHFVFSAEVFHRGGTRAVGIYAARGVSPAGEDWATWFCELVFDDINDEKDVWAGHAARLGKAFNAPPPKGNRAQLHPYAFVTVAGQQSQGSASSIPPFIFNPAWGREVWRTLELEVSPEGARGSWDGHEIGMIHFAEASAGLRGSFKKRPAGTDFDFNPRGPLGLQVNCGTASFRNVKVKPLADAP